MSSKLQTLIQGLFEFRHWLDGEIEKSDGVVRDTLSVVRSTLVSTVDTKETQNV
jgi:hypothetical protein